MVNAWLSASIAVPTMPVGTLGEMKRKLATDAFVFQ